MTNSSGAPQNIDTSKVSTPQFPIEDYLEKAGKEHSLQNLRALRLTFKKQSDKAVSFVGAGISKPLGVPDWSDLMIALVEECTDLAMRYFAETVADNGRRQFRGSVRPEEYPRIADEVFNALGYQRYTEIIKQHMQPTINTTTATLQQLVLAVSVHLTTNFERYIEATYNYLERMIRNSGGTFARTLTVKDFTQATDYPSSSDPDWLCYLHASVDRGIFVLPEREYKRVYKHVGGAGDVHECIKHFFRHHHLLFVGFSFDDPYVKGCVERIAAELEQSDQIYKKQQRDYGRDYSPREQRHFLLIDSGPENAIWHGRGQDKEYYFADWHRLGILPIVYEAGRHVFLQYLFEELAGLAKR